MWLYYGMSALQYPDTPNWDSLASMDSFKSSSARKLVTITAPSRSMMCKIFSSCSEASMRTRDGAMVYYDWTSLSQSVVVREEYCLSVGRWVSKLTTRVLTSCIDFLDFGNPLSYLLILRCGNPISTLEGCYQYPASVSTFHHFYPCACTLILPALILFYCATGLSDAQ